MTQIVKSIRIFVAALACLWPLVFFTGLPAAAAVLSEPSSSAVAVVAEPAQGVFQRHEPSFFLDTESKGTSVSAGGASEPQRASAGSPMSLGTAAFLAVLLLAAFNARKRRSRTALAQS